VKGRLLFGTAAVVVAAIVIAAFTLGGKNEDKVTYRFGTVERGEIVNAISTSGSLGAVVTVEVGTQISGQIAELHADYNTAVTAGQLIARIDPQTFEAKVRQAEAELAVAIAGVSNQRATLARNEADIVSSRAGLSAARANSERYQASVVETERNLERLSELLQRGVTSNREVERARAEADSATAQLRSSRAQEDVQAAAIGSSGAGLDVAMAQLESALAQVRIREAALEQALIDLERTFIRSPVDGIVIDRAVSTGQTVSASLNAPVLFTIAQDLTTMQVEAAVDEADIGRVREGLAVTFTVDAFPEDNFSGRVQQIRRAPKVEQNVVTYIVVVSAANPQSRLLPGMTANVEIIVERRDNALRVSNAALRFRPAGAPAPPAAGTAQARPPGGRGGGGAPGGGRGGFASIAQQLDLSEDQQEQVAAIGAETRARFQQLRAEGATQDEIRAEFQAGRAQTQKRFQAILTPEQRAKLAEITSAAAGQPGSTAGRVWILGAGGEPQPIEIRYGVSNASRTEIVSDGLEEGQQVIVGATRISAQPQSRGFRFGF
jgi:HlyD family secretion protein